VHLLYSSASSQLLLLLLLLGLSIKCRDLSDIVTSLTLQGQFTEIKQKNLR